MVLGATIGITRPTAVTWLDSNLFTYALGFLMLSMGLTLTIEDFKRVSQICRKPLSDVASWRRRHSQTMHSLQARMRLPETSPDMASVVSFAVPGYASAHLCRLLRAVLHQAHAGLPNRKGGLTPHGRPTSSFFFRL